MGRQKTKPEESPTNGPVAAAEPEPLPAYFLSLTLENVRCFGPKQELKLTTPDGKQPARWTIILGLNGTGKTTLLQSLAGFKVTPTTFTREAGSETNELWYVPQAISEISANYRDGLRTDNPMAECTARIVFSSALEVVSKVISNISIVTEGTRSEWRGVINTKGLWCCAYGAGRRLGTASMFGTGSRDTPTGSLFSDDAELRNPEEWLIELDYTVKSNKNDLQAQQRFDQAKELLLKIMPEGEIADIRCQSGNGPNPKSRAEFKTPYGWVPLRQLGYGYQTLITWVADLANRMAERYPDSKKPLAEPAVVLVDEIDLHLHPIWQRKLMGFLTERFPNTQFIATAHSPLVAQAAADANLAVLRREGDHVVIDNEVDNIRNWRIDQILTSDLFGLKTARPPHVEAMMTEREHLLEKSKLTATEKRRLKELNELVESLPFGETAQERDERAAIKQALDVLMKERKSAP